MAHFYTGISGQSRTEATRIGSKNSGITAFTNGWNSGVKIYGIYDAEKDLDIFHIYATHGSNKSGSSLYLGSVYRDKETNQITFE